MKLRCINTIPIITLLLALSLTQVVCPKTFTFHEAEQDLNKTLSYHESILLEFLEEKMQLPHGGIRTNFSKSKNCEYGVKGNQVLSETVGLMMQYYILKNNQKGFDYQYDYFKKYMLKENGFIPWVIQEDKKNISHVTATIDDIRIADALLKASERWNEKKYRKTTEEIIDSIFKYEVNNDNLVSCYDWDKKEKSKEVKLSYLDIETLKEFSRFQPGFGEVISQSLNLLKHSCYPKTPFYHTLYNQTSKNYIEDKKINLIDSLLVALHLQKAGVNQEEIIEWLKKEFAEKGKIFGCYDPQKGCPVVNYESTAVYSLCIQLSLSAGENNFAEKLLCHMLLMQDLERNSPSFGGFVDKSNNDGHSFDNIQALIAIAQYQKYSGG